MCIRDSFGEDPGLYKTSSGAEAYWTVTSGNLFPSFGPNTQLSPIGTGWLQLSATAWQACRSHTATRSMWIEECTGKGAIVRRVRITPNPVKNNLTLALHNFEQALYDQQGISINIIENSNGQVRYQFEPALNTEHIDVSNWNEGMYQVLVQTNDETEALTT